MSINPQRKDFPCAAFFIMNGWKCEWEMQKGMRKNMELLAPAGDGAALRAAVCAGADAVYLGLQSFGARASAANFDAEELARAVEYAHLYHVRVYVTVNTLVKERELAAVRSALEVIAQARADAVIVQDMGVASLVKALFPTLGLHASTQMALHNATGAQWARKQGFERVVLARECSLAEIREAAQTDVEIEVFAHGALCAGVSGQCLMSSMAGGRSGNRGRCAQPCRQEVCLGAHRGALLSMKDLCLRDCLPELMDAGVRAIKIEGRMKRPEYVAIVTESYRRALDDIAAGRFATRSEKEQERLCQIYHRGGFTTGHTMGVEDADLCATRHVGHGGVLIGDVLRVKNGLATVSLCRTVHDGDGLELRGRTQADLRYSGKDRAAGEEALLRLREGVSPAVGDSVFRLTAVRQMAEAKAMMHEKPIRISMEAALTIGRPLSLTISDGQTVVKVQGEVAQRALTRATTVEDARKQLGKLGDTPFALLSEGDLAVFVEDGAFVPVSAWNALRREAAQGLIKARASAFFGRDKEALLSRAQGVSTPLFRKCGKANGGNAPLPWTDTFAVRFGDAALAPRFAEAGVNLLLYAPKDFSEKALAESIGQLPRGAWLELPPQVSEKTLGLVQDIVSRQAGTLGGVVMGSVGQWGQSLPLSIAFGVGIPITNTGARGMLAEAQPAFWVLWPELSLEEMKAMEPLGTNPLLTMYGRERLMVLNHCPWRVAEGLTRGRAGCKLCDGGRMACGQADAALTDRKGFHFPLQRIRMGENCVVNVLNALPTDLRRQEEARKALGAGTLLSFTVEEPEEQLRIVEEFARIRKGEAVSLPKGVKTTQGHFFRSVE